MCVLGGCLGGCACMGVHVCMLLCWVKKVELLTCIAITNTLCTYNSGLSSTTIGSTTPLPLVRPLLHLNLLAYTYYYLP